MPASTLTQLQHRVLEAFFRREKRFFLTGGAALAGFHLGHRRTHDLDLFTASDVLDEGERTLAEVARELSAEIENIQTSPDFRRRILRAGDEAIVIDLVYDRAPQAGPDKLQFGQVRVDSPLEILANKLCAVLSRSEQRDLVDLHALVKAGVSVEEALPLAQQKDSGLTTAQLAWVLSQVELPPEQKDLAEFVAEIAHLLRSRALPAG